MGRGPSVVAGPEEKGTMGVESKELACCSVSALPTSANERAPPTTGTGVALALGDLGDHLLECTFPQWPLGAVSPPLSGPLDLCN